ncbi:MAG: hypothetical protein WKG00_06440 [Polyangiaceae bacterium]
MSRRGRRRGCALGALAASGEARAEGTSLRADLIDATTLKIDGLPKEWPSPLVGLKYGAGGAKVPRRDLDARALLAYDATQLFVAADVLDDKLRPGDAVELVLGFPGGALVRVRIVPGEPGKSAGSATVDGAAVTGAKVVEAPSKAGWTIEASIPWAAIPAARTARVGLRAAILVHDADESDAVESTVGTAPSTGASSPGGGSITFAALPPLSTESEQAYYDGLYKEKKLSGPARLNVLTDVVGDGMKERVIVHDRYLVVLGPTFRGGTEYYWSDLLGEAGGAITLAEVRELTGDARNEIVIRKRVGKDKDKKSRELYQVLSFAGAEVPAPIFQHEVGITTEEGTIQNEVSTAREAANPTITVKPGTAKGLDASNYREPIETSVFPMLFPWGNIASQTYRWSGGKYDKASEQKQAGIAAPTVSASTSPASTSSGTTSAPTPTPASPLARAPGDQTGKVYAQFKKDRGLSGAARFDIQADVAGDRIAERVIFQGRELMVFGRAYRSGTEYSFLTLPQFADPADVLEVSARDLTGDGKTEIVVRGVQRQPAPPEVGTGTVERELFLVFQVQGDVIKRIFAAETSRALGKKRVFASVAFVPSGKQVDIELPVAKATEWTDKTYPFAPETGAVGGVEQLVLPWSGQKAARFRWNGTAFAR